MTIVHIATTGEMRNPIGELAPPDMLVASGFGQAMITVDGEALFDGDPSPEYGNVRGKWVKSRCPVAARSRKVMRFILTPLWNATWERRAPGEWVCIEAGEGFA